MPLLIHVNFLQLLDRFLSTVNVGIEDIRATSVLAGKLPKLG